MMNAGARLPDVGDVVWIKRRPKDSWSRATPAEVQAVRADCVTVCTRDTNERLELPLSCIALQNNALDDVENDDM